MKRISLLTLFLGLSAWADSIYMAQKVDFQQRKIKLSFLPNTSAEKVVKECSLRNDKELVQRYDLNLNLPVVTKLQTFDVQLDLPRTLITPDDLSSMKLTCVPEVKSTGWILETAKTSSKILKGWRLKNGKLFIPKGDYVLQQAIKLKVAQIEIEKQVRIKVADSKVLFLEGNFTPIKNLIVQGNIVLHSDSEIHIESSEFSGSTNQWWDSSHITCALCIKSSEVKMRSVRVHDTKTNIGLEIKADRSQLIDVRLERNRSGMMLVSSDSHISELNLIESSSYGVILSRGYYRIHNSLFSRNKYHLKCENQCRLKIHHSHLNAGDYGIWLDNDSQLISSENVFKKLQVAIGAYRSQLWSKGSFAKDEKSKIEEVNLFIDKDSFSKVEL